MKNESKDQISDVRSARDAKQRENRILWVVSLLALPFIVLATFLQSATTIKVLQACLLTGVVFGGLIFLPKRPETNKWWFWKAIATGFLIHVAVLTGVFYWDDLNPQAAAKAFVLMGLLYVASMVELFLILVIIEIFRPEDELGDTQVK